MSTTNELWGRWLVVSWEQQYADGRVERPMGDQLEGFIDYTSDGNMTCMISRKDRARFEKGGQWNAPDEEKARAYDSMLFYAGRYRVDGQTIVHMVDISLFPNWKGGEQKREFQFQPDGTLALLARLEQGTPEARVSRLVWRRHESNEKGNAA
ncbi:lipocalin-like domain-containing protein [Noviherbaspirillum saxi]|uniref:Lipocalin-like domain-containing protein n=1 Tax=Noviherbaspirillum saxi TaxID=2320863 RepID=A0A3A3FKE0_9BURK|nr:lipocalin-like domain-containing protein [Noviherbaspirillum saxi]RJF95767.1 lipocalin-like domain-containing protein [Noviherbaspirillum saxi]